MYPDHLKSHLRATVTAAWIFGMAQGYWMTERREVAGAWETVVLVFGTVILMGVVFSRIDAALLPKP